MMDQNGVHGTADDIKSRSLSRKVVDESGRNVTDYVDLRQMPSFTTLREKVCFLLTCEHVFK